MNPQVQSGFLFEDASGRKAVPPVSASPELWHCPDPFLSNREMPVLSAGTCPHADAGKRKAGRTACLRHACGAASGPAEFRRRAGTCAPLSANKRYFAKERPHVPNIVKTKAVLHPFLRHPNPVSSQIAFSLRIGSVYDFFISIFFYGMDFLKKHAILWP